MLNLVHTKILLYAGHYSWHTASVYCAVTFISTCVCCMCRSRTTSLWSLLCELAAGLKKSNRPSSRLLFSGAIAFLWERERIPTDDAIRYVCCAHYVHNHTIFMIPNGS